MIIAKPVIKRVSSQVNSIIKSEPTIDNLVKEIKMILIKAVTVRGVPASMCEDVASKHIVLSAMVEPPTVK